MLDFSKMYNEVMSQVNNMLKEKLDESAAKANQELDQKIAELMPAKRKASPAIIKIWERYIFAGELEKAAKLEEQYEH